MAAVDPNVQAILNQHQQQLQIVQQQQQQNQQLAQAREDERRLDKWLTEQREKVGCCDGSGLRDVRKWLANIHAAIHRVPQGGDVERHILQLIEKTATEDLLDEIEAFSRHQQAANPPVQVTHAALRAHIQTAFLGPDEANVLKDELRSIKQTQREDVPRFNRRFLKAADLAYPQPRDANTEELVTDKYLGALLQGKIKDRVFSHDPQLVTLAAAMQVSSEEWARQRRRQRIQRECQREEEPMEVNEAAPVWTSSQEVGTVRDTLAAIAGTIKTLQSDVAELKRPTSTASAAPQEPSARPSGGRPKLRCFYCNRPGHYKRNCLRRKRDQAAEGAQQSEQGN
jgi:hypothetical protein